MSTYLNNALSGWERSSEETYRIRAGAYLLALEGMRRSVRVRENPDFPDGFTADELNDIKISHMGYVRSLVYDAFAFLAKVSEMRFADRQWKSWDYYSSLEELAYKILINANAENEAAMLEAAEAMALLTPHNAR